METAILDAARRGDSALADQLGLELAIMNETMSIMAPIRTVFDR